LLDAETKPVVDGFDEWRKGLREVAVAAKAGDYQQVIEKGAAIRDIYPDYVEAGSVYEFRADAFVALNDNAAAIKELERYAKIGGRHPETLKKLASMLVEAGRSADASAALDRLNYIDPVDEDLHRRLGDLWFNQNNLEGAIREYRAVVASKPVDPAASHYNLARAYRGAKRPEQARDELLLALEAAPGYRPAQKMLLELSQSEQGK